MALKTNSLKMPDTTAPTQMTPMHNMIHRQENHNNVIVRSISIDPKLYKTLKRYAADNDTSVSGILSRLAKDFLEKEKYH